MIPFNVPLQLGTELEHVRQAAAEGKLCGDGRFTKACVEWFERRFGGSKVLLTTSCTHALDMTALLAGIEPGDEVIMPSFTFVSTANAFVLRGAVIVFVDVDPTTMNMDERLVEAAITGKTRAIVPMHYAGVGCEMDEINRIAREHGLFVIEDAAQGMMASYDGRELGTLGDFGCYSFHETKNFTCGEGGLLIVNNKRFAERAEIIREKGTDRARFFRGLVDKYTWVDIGSSYLPSELNAAFLLAQLEHAEEVTNARVRLWQAYRDGLSELERDGLVELPRVPPRRKHNGHLFFVKVRDLSDRRRVISRLKERGIQTAFHYVPLHSSPAGTRFGRFHGHDDWTTRESDRLLRLPLWYGLQSQDLVIEELAKILRE